MLGTRCVYSLFLKAVVLTIPCSMLCPSHHSVSPLLISPPLGASCLTSGGGLISLFSFPDLYCRPTAYWMIPLGGQQSKHWTHLFPKSSNRGSASLSTSSSKHSTSESFFIPRCLHPTSDYIPICQFEASPISWIQFVISQTLSKLASPAHPHLQDVSTI